MTSKVKMKVAARKRRHGRVRSRLRGTSKVPRVSVYRSNTTMYVQLIDDDKGDTIFAMSDHGETGKNKTERANAAGKKLAESASKKGIKQLVFDRGGFKYGGRVAAVAEGIRKGGIKV